MTVASLQPNWVFMMRGYLCLQVSRSLATLHLLLLLPIWQCFSESWFHTNLCFRGIFYNKQIIFNRQGHHHGLSLPVSTYSSQSRRWWPVPQLADSRHQHCGGRNDRQPSGPGHSGATYQQTADRGTSVCIHCQGASVNICVYAVQDGVDTLRCL